MNVNMDPMEINNVAADNSEEQQSRSEGAETSTKPPLSEIKKSWGFRRTTIAKREFLEEVREVSHSPSPVRRGKGRKSNQTPQTPKETLNTRRSSRTTKSVIDELEWSAPSSPASEDSGKLASETSAGGNLDPSLWQDYGSAFHTAFSLLGGGEDLTLDMSGSRAIPDILGLSDVIEPAPPLDPENEATDNSDSSNEMEISQPVVPETVSGEETDDVILISSQEEESDEMTLSQIKEMAAKSRQVKTGARGGKGGRGKARGRGRGRGKGKGRGKGRGRGRGVELLSTIADQEDDDVVFVGPSEQHLQEEERLNNSHSLSEIERSPADFDIRLSPAQRSGSDCIIIDTDLDHITDVTPGQFDDTPDEKVEEEKTKDDENVIERSGKSASDGHDSDALYCICRQKRDERFMICCNSCQDWFHYDCIGITETQARELEQKGQEYICPRCTTQRQSQLQPEPQLQLQLDPELSFPEFPRPPSEDGKGNEEPRAPQEAVVEVEKEEEKEKEETAPLMKPEPVPEPVPQPEPEPEADMETESSLPLCIGPGCLKPALQDSVYCGTDCILQHAAFTMKTLSGPKVPKSKGRGRGKAAAARPAVKGQRSGRMSRRLAGKAAEKEDEDEEEVKEGVGGDAASTLACDSSPSEAQPSSIPSSKFYTASNEDTVKLEAKSETETPLNLPAEDSPIEAASSSEPASEPTPTPSQAQEKSKDPIKDGASEQETAVPVPYAPPSSAKPDQSTAIQSPSTSGNRHHGTGALMVSKTSYVIPKKQSGLKPPPSKVPASTSGQKPSSAPTLLSETRNLPVPPAPSAPSSRPSQPNTQIRQSIQRSLTSILFKRVSDCEDLEMSESEVTKLVASIEMEMFDMFRNTDSKYMNKYRTIMFNLKDPKNKGLLYNVVHSEISPFRLVRMSQKDMQAVKASEPSQKAATEVKDATKSANVPQKPEAVKVDLPSLNPPRPIKNIEQKKSLPAPSLKARTSQLNPGNVVPDIFACMLKDTTSEHKAHLFDLKCKICTGQIAGEEEEPAKKKPKVSEAREKYESPWKKSAGDDSPLMAPPDSPDMDSPTSSIIDPSSRLIIDAPPLTIVESPASPTMESPASPILESPASPTMESPASPIPETPKTTIPKRSYTPVVIPAVSTVTITRRDPRTAAGRFSAPSSSNSGPSNTTQNLSNPYVPFKESHSTTPSVPPSSVPQKKTLPKSILMKPSSSADPRLYGTPARTTVSPADSETAQFLAKEDIVWKGFLNMLTVAKFVTKAYLVSGPAENLKADLPDTIQIGGRILPETVWDYVAKLKTSVTKELCVIRFHPATEEEEVAYVSLFSYFSSRRRFGVVANVSRSIKDVYLFPLSAKESIPTILQPLEGPGLEKNRPNLLLGLAIIQKTKRAGALSQEIEEKRPKVQMAKDPAWIPKPPVLYGSDKLEIFQPYDPETPVSTTPPSSPSCPGSPSGSSSSGSVTIPSLLTSVTAKPPVSTSASVTASHSSAILSDKDKDKDPSTVSSDKTPLQTILKSLFVNKKNNIDSHAGGSTTTVSSKKAPVFSQGSILDPIVQQYGQKSKVKEIEEEEDYFDRPYDPEEEYEPAMGYGMVTTQSIEPNWGDEPTASGSVDDDVAYDPEDETFFADFQSDNVTKVPVSTPSVPTQTSDLSLPTSIPPEVPAPSSTAEQTPTPIGITEHLPTGSVVVSAATLTEQQRMLEELNKQIEEQKRQLKEQEEALRQQREAVGMFMAHFSVADSLMSPPSKSLPLSQLSSLQSGMMQTDPRLSESTNKASNLAETVDVSNAESQAVNVEGTTPILSLKTDPNTVPEQDETQENVKEGEKCSSAGEIEDSDVAYDPEDESLFDEIQEDVFRGGSHDSSLSKSGHSTSHKDSTGTSYHSRKRRLSPKRRSHREREGVKSPSRRSQRRSPSHSRRHRERDRHRRSERERSGHRSRDHSARQSHRRRERTASRHSREHRRSPSSHRKKGSLSPSAKQHRGHSPQVQEKSKQLSGPRTDPEFSDSVVGQLAESKTSSFLQLTVKKEPVTLIVKKDPDTLTIKKDPDEYLFEENLDGCARKEHTILHNVKLEISEASKPPNYLVLDHDKKFGDLSTETDKPSQQEILFHDKIETSLPLRIIDPPIRDSPESPDPDPRFMKPSSSEQSDSVTIEETRDPVVDNSVPVPLVKAENVFLPLSDPKTLSNVPGPIPLSTDLNQDQVQVEADKQIKGDCLSSKYPTTKGHVKGNSDQAICSIIQNSKPVVDHLTDCPVFGVRGPGPDMKELGPGGLLFGKTDERSQEPVMSDQGPQSVSPNMWSQGQQVKPLAISCKQTNVGDPGAEIQGMETNTRKGDSKQQVDNTLSSETGMRGFGKRSTVQGEDSPDRRCSSREHMQSRHDERGFHSHGSDANVDMEGGGHKTSLDLSVFAGADCSVQKADRLSAAMADDVPVTCSEQDRKGSQEHFNQPESYMESNRSKHGSDSRESDSMHKVRRSDVTEKRHMGSCQTVTNPCWPGTKDDTRESHTRSSSKDISETRPNREEADMSGRNIHGHWPEARNLQINQENRGPMKNITNPDGRGPGTDARELMKQNDGQGPCGRDQDWSEPRSARRNEWREPDRRGSDHSRGGQFMHNQRRVQPDWRGPNLETQKRDRRSDVDLKNREPGPDNNKEKVDFVSEKRRQRGSDFRRPETESRVPISENLEPRMRGSGSQKILGTELDCRGSSTEGPVSDRGETDFRDAWPEKRNLEMVSQGRDRRGPRHQEVWGPGSESTGQTGAIRQETGHPVFTEPGPERRGLCMGDDRLSRRGPEGQGFRGPGLERGFLATENRGFGGPDFRGQGTGCSGPRGRDFSEPRPEKRGPPIEGSIHLPREPGPDFREQGYEGKAHPGPDRGRPRDPDFRGPGPVGRDPPVWNPGPDRRGPMDGDLRGPCPQRRGLSMDGSVHDERGPGCSDLREPGHHRRGPPIEGPGHDQRRPGGPDIRRTSHQRRGPSMSNPIHDERGPVCPDLRGPGPQRRGPPMEGPEQDQRGPGGPDLRGPSPQRRGPHIDGPIYDKRGPRGPDFVGPGSESKNQFVGPSGPNRGRPGEPDFRRAGSEDRDPSMQGPGPNRRGPGVPDFRGPSPQRRDLPLEGPGAVWMGPGPDFRGPGPEKRSTFMQGSTPDSEGHGHPDFRESGPELIGPIQESNAPLVGGTGPDFSQSEPESRGPALHVPLPDGRGPGGPDFGGPGLVRRSPSVENPLRNRREFRGPNCSRPGPEWRDPAIEGMKPETGEFGTGFQDFNSPVIERAHHIENQVTGKRGPQDLDFQGALPDGRGPGGPDVRGPGYERNSPSIQGSGPERRGPFVGASGPDFMDMGPVSIGPGMQCPETRNRGQRGPQFMESVHSNMEGPTPHGRVPDFRGPRTDRASSGIEGSQGHCFRGPGFQHSGPNIEGPGPYRRGPDNLNFTGPGPETMASDIEGPETDRRGQTQGQDFRGPGCHSSGQAILGLGPHRQESGFREPGERRELHVRESDWRRSGSPDLGLRHREDRGRPDFGGSEYGQEEGHSNRSGQNMRARGPRRGNMRGHRGDLSTQGDRWKGPDFRDSTPDWRSSDTQHQWSDEHGINMMATGDERQFSGDDWKGHCDLGQTQEGVNEQFRELRHSRGIDRGGPGRRGQRPIKQRQNMSFPCSSSRPGEEWSGPDHRDPGPTQDDPVCPGPGIGRPGNEWRGPNRGGSGPSKRDIGPCFREEMHMGSRGRGHNRRGSDVRPDMRRGSHMRIDCAQPDFRGQDMEGSEDHRGGQGLIDSCTNRGFEGPDRRGPNLIHSGPEDRNFNIECPGTDGRFSDGRGQGFERQRLEHDFRRGRRESENRGQRPDMRHGRRCNLNDEAPGLGPRGSGSALPNLNNPHRVPQFQAPNDPHSAKYNRPFGTAEYNEGNACPGSETLQNQQEVKPQRQRVALLPTPTGLTGFPNRMTNKPEICSPKQRQGVHLTEREWSRGRPLSSEREVVKGNKQEQDRTMTTPVDEGTGGKEKRS